MMIREAVESDAPTIVKVHIDVWRTTYAGIVSANYLKNLDEDTHIRNWYKWFRAKKTNETFLVIQDDHDRIFGFASGGPEREGNKTYRAEIRAIYMLQEYQRKGYGRMLVAALANCLWRRAMCWRLFSRSRSRMKWPIVN